MPPPAEGTAEAAARVAASRAAQQARAERLAAQAGAEPAAYLNARAEGERLSAIAGLDEPGRALLGRAAEAHGLTARGWTRALRLARTIADLDGAEAVRRVHVAEALIYRRTGPEGAGAMALKGMGTG